MNRNASGGASSTWTVGPAAMLLALCAGCGSALGYGSGDAQSLPAPRAKVAFAGIMDGRVIGTPSELSVLEKGADRVEELATLNEAVREHVEHAGLAGRWLGAPQSRVEAERALDDAARRGEGAVVFFKLRGVHASGHASLEALITNVLLIFGVAPGILPLFITYSTPNGTESAGARIEAVVVEPKTRRTLAVVDERVVKHDDSVSYWGYSPEGELEELLFICMEKVLARVGATLASPPKPSEKDALDALFPPAQWPARVAKGASR